MPQSDSAVSRRKLLATIGASSALGLAGCSQGSSADAGTESSTDYPTEEIESIVPYATGGGFDAYSRITAPYWQKHLPNDATVTVKNVVGGGGVKGTVQTYNAKPDGYTFQIWDAYQAVTQQVGRDVGYDMREMSHIGAITQSPNTLVGMKSAKLEGWNDLVNRIGELNFATQGVGSISHTGVVLLGELTGAWSKDDINFVHYGGTGEALSGLERGEAQAFLVGTATSGLKVVKALEAEMVMLFSDPVGEDSIYHGKPKQFSGNLDVKNMDRYSKLTTFRRFFTGPPGVPEEILNIQRDAFSKIIEDKEFRKKAKEKGRPIVNPGSAEQVSNVLKSQFDTFGTDPMKSTIESVFNS